MSEETDISTRSASPVPSHTSIELFFRITPREIFCWWQRTGHAPEGVEAETAKRAKAAQNSANLAAGFSSDDFQSLAANVSRFQLLKRTSDSYIEFRVSKTRADLSLVSSGKSMPICSSLVPSPRGPDVQAAWLDESRAWFSEGPTKYPAMVLKETRVDSPVPRGTSGPAKTRFEKRGKS